MRIRYLKPGGVAIFLPDPAARRLIASGQAEEIASDEPPIQDPMAARRPRVNPPAKTTTPRSR